MNARLKAEWKNKLKARAQMLFPGLAVTLATSDALLILHWAMLRDAGFARVAAYRDVAAILRDGAARAAELCLREALAALVVHIEARVN